MPEQSDPSEWVTIKHPKTGGQATVPRAAFDEYYSNADNYPEGFGAWKLVGDANGPGEVTTPSAPAVTPAKEK